MDLTSTVKLNNGVEIPWVGLGVFKSAPGAETEQAVRWALEIGYRHIDTAAFYENEADVGRALKDSGVAARDVFVTTKVWNTDQGYEQTLKAFDRSRRRSASTSSTCTSCTGRSRESTGRRGRRWRSCWRTARCAPSG